MHLVLGMTQLEIAEQINLHKITINNIINMFKNTGRISLSQRKTQYFKMYECNYFKNRDYMEVLDLEAMHQEYDAAIVQPGNADHLIFDAPLLEHIRACKERGPQ